MLRLNQNQNLQHLRVLLALVPQENPGHMINGHLAYLEVLEAGLYGCGCICNKALICFIHRGSGGKPFGDGDKEKWYIFGATGAIALLATLAFWEMGYKEIGWKEFVHKYDIFNLFINSNNIS